MMFQMELFLRKSSFVFITLSGFLISGSTSSGCKDKYRIISSHSACLQKASVATPGKVDKIDALAVHNKYRKIIQSKYKATDMLKMVWDEEVAMVAQRWAENCNVGHDDNKNRNIPGRFSVGQNIASGMTALSWETVVQLFYNESAKFTYRQSGQNLHDIGHFTQLAWAESYILGCGYSICKNGAKETHFYVCNYSPSGNHNGQLGTPFKTGAGTLCKKEENGLCDCGSTICEMNSKLDPRTCLCNCSKSYYGKPLDFVTGTSCRLNCKTGTDPGYCKQSYKPSQCLTQTNVPFECPTLCKVCPYADVNYKETGGKGIGGSGWGGQGGGGGSMPSFCLVSCILLLFCSALTTFTMAY